MRRFLVDTNVLSAFGPERAKTSVATADWFRANAGRLFISAITVMEIESGIRQFARTGSRRRLANLSAWLAETMDDFRNQVLPFDEKVAMVAGRLEAMAITKGRHPGLPDIIIAATAELQAMTILTQNLRHFEPLEVPCMDPFKGVLDMDR